MPRLTFERMGLARGSVQTAGCEVRARFTRPGFAASSGGKQRAAARPGLPGSQRGGTWRRRAQASKMLGASTSLTFHLHQGVVDVCD
ncbi:hypothetical protein PSP6_800021 [Paraburkholderia tropica]|nr:hypothetical protein PSP6_800021 [Paraburkholderia tropica]